MFGKKVLKFRTFILVLFLLSAGKAIAAPESSQPHLTTYCAVLMDQIGLDAQARSNQVLYPLREFKIQMERQLKDVQAHGKTWVELLAWENRQGANLSPHTSDLVVDGPLDPSAKSELTIGKVLGRLDLLEEDISEFNPGAVTYAREISGAENIEQFLNSVDQGSHSLEEILKPKIDSQFSYWNDVRTGHAFKVGVASILGIGLPIIALSDFHSVFALIHQNPIIAANLAFPYIFRKAYSKSWDYFTALISKSGKIKEDNTWYYRATQFAEKNKLVRQLLKNPDVNASVYYGFGVPVTNELSDILIHGGDPGLKQEKIYDSIRQHRTEFEEEDIRWAFIDFIFYFEPETHSPTLIVASRIKKTFILPAPKKKERQAEKESEKSWSVLPGAVPTR